MVWNKCDESVVNLLFFILIKIKIIHFKKIYILRQCKISDQDLAGSTRLKLCNLIIIVIKYKLL